MNGLSNSMPLNVQEKMVRSVEGLGSAVIVKPAYAIEYDCYDPRCLELTLESRIIPGLFLAGQVNGTSGYEEAAAQGLAAGINAALALQGKQQVVFSRADSYLGVLIDDIVTQGVDEPYRLFSSRAEFRLSLRQDNADLRLCPLAFKLGLINENQYSRVRNKQSLIEDCLAYLKKTRVSPERINPFLRQLGSADSASSLSLEKLLRRPEVPLKKVLSWLG